MSSSSAAGPSSTAALQESNLGGQFLALWERCWDNERPALEKRLSAEQLGRKRPYNREELRDLSKLWLMLSLRLHPHSGTQGLKQLSGLRLSWGEFQLAFSASWHAMIIKRVFDIIDSVGDGVISFDDFARGLFPLASSQASLDDKLHFLFQCLDLDGSEAISREELLVHLHMYVGQSLCEEDCTFSAEQLEQVVSATFAAAELDSAGHIGRGSFVALLRQQPRLVAALKQRLCLNVNQTIANLIMGLDAGWLVVGERTHRSATSSPQLRPGERGGRGESSERRQGGARSWADGCTRDVTHWLRRTCLKADASRDRRRAWDACLKQIRARFRDRQEYVPTLVVIVP